LDRSLPSKIDGDPLTRLRATLPIRELASISGEMGALVVIDGTGLVRRA
jgi:hypothetical protein